MCVQMLTLAYTACQSCGSNYYFHTSTDVLCSSDNTGVRASGGRKRGFNEAMGMSQSMDVDDANGIARQPTQSDAGQSLADLFQKKVDILRG